MTTSCTDWIGTVRTSHIPAIESPISSRGGPVRAPIPLFGKADRNGVEHHSHVAYFYHLRDGKIAEFWLLAAVGFDYREQFPKPQARGNQPWLCCRAMHLPTLPGVHGMPFTEP